MRLLKIGQILLPESDAEQDFPVEGRNALVPLRNGAFDQDGTNLVLQSGKISHRAILLADNLDSEADQLYKELSLGRLILVAELRDKTRRATWAKLSNLSRPVETEKYSYQQIVNIEWAQDYPFWWQDGDIWFLDTGEFLDSGLILDGNTTSLVVTTTVHAFQLNNPGTIRSNFLTFYILPRAASSITNPELVNTTNQYQWKYTGVVSALSTLFVDNLTKTVEYNGADAYANLSVNNNKQIEWMILDTGINSLEFRASAITGTVDIVIIWPRLYL